MAFQSFIDNVRPLWGGEDAIVFKNIKFGITVTTVSDLMNVEFLARCVNK